MFRDVSWWTLIVCDIKIWYQKDIQRKQLIETGFTQAHIIQ